MPRMSGTELATQLCVVRPDLRVIFMTGYAEFSEKNNEKLPAEASVLQKPFSSAALLEKVREILGAAPREHPSGATV
jgi:two-component system cell cycle sensor histidine kinase/response regulator CckA